MKIRKSLNKEQSNSLTARENPNKTLLEVHVMSLNDRNNRTVFILQTGTIFLKKVTFLEENQLQLFIQGFLGFFKKNAHELILELVVQELLRENYLKLHRKN